MDLREQIRRRRKDARFVGAGLGLLLLVCLAFYYLLQRGRGLPQPLLANRVLLFALWYVNVILILTVLFIVVRGLFRVLLERRSRVLGSKFKTKLVLSAIGLSLIPVLIIFPFATKLMVESFDQFFDLPIEGLVDQMGQTAHALIDQVHTTNRRDAALVLGRVIDLDLEDLGQRPALQSRLHDLLDELQLDYVGVYDGTELVHSYLDPTAGFSRDLVFRGLDRFLREAAESGDAVHLEDAPGVEGRLLLAARAAPSKRRPEAEPPRKTLVVVGRVLPPALSDPAKALLDAQQSYRQLESQRDALRTLNLQILLLVTLLVVLAFSSIGLRLARRVTAPIQALSEATRRVGQGDLEHRVVTPVDDELAVLVDGFNRMIEELASQRGLVDRTNRELVAANERVAAVLQNLAAGVVSLDAQGRVQTCNGAALAILQQRPKDVVGKPIEEAWADPERGKLVTLLGAGRPLAGDSAQVRLAIGGGVVRTLELKVTRLPEAGAGGAGRVVVLEDLTELIHAQKMAAWTEVARRIAHEIKNPLTPIKLTAERLLRKHRQGDELGAALEQGVEVIVREVETLKSMVDEFSRYARMPQPRPRDVDLAALVADTLGLYQGLKPGVEVESRVATGAQGRFDPEQLKSVLINLLDNAVEAVEPPGRVVVSTAGDDGRVLLRVADSGPGIRAEDKEKLFLPYFSTKGRGTGLGLAIVHRIVSDNDATIQVEDNRPHGTVFTLEIPVG